MGKADIYQVAKEAGVSISTVSRAFTRPELVSAKTRRKVLDWPISSISTSPVPPPP